LVKESGPAGRYPARARSVAEEGGEDEAMTTDVLPEFAFGTAEVVRRTLERPFSRGMVEEFFDGVLRQAGLVLELIVDFRNRLCHQLDTRGLDPRSLQADCNLSLRALDALIDSYQHFHNLYRTDKTRDAEVRRQEAKAAEVRRSFAQWSETLARPRPAIDWEKVAEDARAAEEAGRMIRVEKFSDLFPSHPDDA
jgi:hypothetical protein